MPEAFLGLGSNLGDREAMLRAAMRALAASDGVTVTACSPIYETPPWGPVPQGPYLNACVAIDCTLTPRALLDLALAIERRHGRERAIRWGPRTLDIDILLYGNKVIQSGGLVIPHPRMHLRRFTLLPLAEIAGDMIHPVLNKSIGELLKECTDESEVRRIYPQS